MERVELSTLNPSQGQEVNAAVRRSLAANYLVEILPSVETDNNDSTVSIQIQERWKLTPLDTFQLEGELLASGALATTALYPDSTSSPSITSSIVVEGRVLVVNNNHHHDTELPKSETLNGSSNQNTIFINAIHPLEEDAIDANTALLLSTLSRVMVQRLTSRYHALKSSNLDETLEWHLQLPGQEEQTIQLNGAAMTDQNIWQLFSSSSAVELVEMVCSHGQAIGTLPRNLIHTFNILHRGIGLFVAKDSLPQPFETTTAPTDNESQEQSSAAPSFPDLYVHRRTSWKRIFPSLYDMFVGGISLAGEDSVTTAQREVAEELGLNRDTALSPPLLACTVCTSYNRCVVTLFCYVMDSVQETVSWQQQEVAWGDFVPYPIIEAAADLSIQRLVESKSWPGTCPPTLSSLAGSRPTEAQYDSDDWTTWDFVPDGLLVWEAWLKHLRESRSK